MKILVIGDFTAQPCGIRNFADQTVTALRRHPGLTVDTWDAHYPYIYARREAEMPTYLPNGADQYDVIHHNWHPIALNTYGPDHFPAPRLISSGGYTRQFRRPILSVYLNDIPPWSGCPFHDRADVRFAAEESQGCVVLPYPCADWIDDLETAPTKTFTVGVSTVRGDGVEEVRAVCADRGWELREPNPDQWLSYEDEVRRMARNTVNVLWYQKARGKSGGLSQAISAGRPVICSDSPMFSHFHGEEEIYWAYGDRLDDMLVRVHTDWQEGQLSCPVHARETHAWSYATAQMVAAWKEARQR